MKNKFTKTPFFLIFLGLSLMLTAFVLNGFSLENIQISKDYESQTLLYTEPITKIEVLDTRAAVQIKQSKDGSSALELYKNKENHFDVQLENGVLRVKLEKKFSFFDIIPFLQKKPPTIYLSVPENIDLRFSTANGQLQMQNLSLSHLQIRLVNGKIELDSLTLENLTLESTNAKLEAENIKVSQSASIQGGNGKQNLNSILAENLQVSNTNGKIEGKNLSAKQMQIETTNGKIDIEHIEVEESLHVSSKNGKIEGHSLSAKHIEAQNTNGKIDLNSIDIAESLQISNTNGKVDLSLLGQSQDYNIKINSKSKNHQRWNRNNNASKNIELSLVNDGLDIEFEKE